MAAGAALTSCSEDVDGMSNKQSEGVLRVETSIGKSRAIVTGTTFNTGDRIGLYVTNKDGNAYQPNVNCYNLPATYDNVWNLNNDFKLYEDQAQVFAYYPYNYDTELTDGRIFINATPDAAGEQVDFMYGHSTNTVNMDNPTANIQFQHALSRITLAISKGSGDVGDGLISKVRLENDSVFEKQPSPLGEAFNTYVYKELSNQVCLHEILNVNTGEFERVNDTEAAIELNKKLYLSEKETVYIDLLVVPVKNKDAEYTTDPNLKDKGARIILTIDGHDYELNLGATPWEPNAQYTYPINIKRVGDVLVPEVGEIEYDAGGGVKFKMIKVKGGEFQMGDPAHTVTLSDYFIGETEVTQELWQAIMGENPSTFTYGRNLPVHDVSWEDCQVFLGKLSEKYGVTFKLPTEAQWEYAARGGAKSLEYKYSGSNAVGAVAWYAGNSASQPHPVASKTPNELGLYDMSGNVWEFCNDWYGEYSSEAQTNPEGPDGGTERVVRGGSWINDASYLYTSSRFKVVPTGAGDGIGFRLTIQQP